MHETKYLETFKTKVEVAKASGISFVAMSKPSVKMAMKTLETEGAISRSGKYDSTYFELTRDERTLVDARSEEIFCHQECYRYHAMWHISEANKSYKMIS